MRSTVFFFSAAALVLGLILPAPATAIMPRKIPDDQNILDDGGGGNYQALVSKALSMPATQQAMQEFSYRGYVRWPQKDTAAVIADTAIAILAYQKPGFDPVQEAPILVVVTRLNQGMPHTTVFGGVVVRQPDGTLAASTWAPDAALEVKILDMSSTQSNNYVTDTGVQASGKFWQWVGCTILGCMACSAMNMWPVVGQIVCCIVLAVICHKSIYNA